VRRLALKGLSGAETARLLELNLGDAPSDELVDSVQAETEGNPLFATEIARLLASGSAAYSGGSLPIPVGVKEAIARRLGRQSERCREVLSLASVSGREFDFEVIRRAGGLSEPELLSALEEAESARLVEGTAESSRRLRFAHILVRDALYDDLPAARRLVLHRTIAESIESIHAANAEPHLDELAHHFTEAGDAAADRAIDYSQRAGRAAEARHGYEEAARHYGNALRLLEATGSPDASRTCELLLALGETLSRAGRDSDSKDTLRQAAALAEELGRPDQLARAALAYGRLFGWARASSDPFLVPLLEHALEAIGSGDGRARVALLARLAAARRDDVSHVRRVALAEEALSIARAIGDPASLATALQGHYVAVEGPELQSAGEGVEIGAELIAVGERIGDPEKVFSGHDHRLHGFWAMCDRAGVEVEMEAIAKLAEELRQPAQRWWLGSGQTMMALVEGRFEEAEQLIESTSAAGRRAASWNAAVTQRLALFVLRREQGRLAELEDTMRRSPHEYPALLRFRCALAHLYSELGREREAGAILEPLLARPLDREHRDAEWLFSMSLLVDPCARLADAAAAERLYGWLASYERLYALAPVEAVFGSIARALGVLATTLSRCDDAERHFHVAHELEQSMGARPWLAHVQHDHARMLLQRGGSGDAGRAAELLGTATATYRELGMDHWAERAEADATAPAASRGSPS
jgi:tetratricopeptide (TPR) repeat protein